MLKASSVIEIFGLLGLSKLTHPGATKPGILNIAPDEESTFISKLLGEFAILFPLFTPSQEKFNTEALLVIGKRRTNKYINFMLFYRTYQWHIQLLVNIRNIKRYGNALIELYGKE
jgi:hypothetical protein